MRRKAGKDPDEDGEKIVTQIFEELKSQSLLEQLRLECIADVKQKKTYKQLKERIKDYLTKKMCNPDWTSDAEHVDIFREQVVECGVLTLTVERIVDTVVTRKLHEDLRPLIADIVEKVCSKKPQSKVKQLNSKKQSEDARRNLEETVRFVGKLCDDTQRDSKKIFEDGFISNSLASVSNSKGDYSDDDHFSTSSLHSDLSSYDGDAGTSDDDEQHKTERKKVIKRKRGRPRKESQMPNNNNVSKARSRRERKINPKYSPSLYHTSFPACHSSNYQSSLSSFMQQNDGKPANSTKAQERSPRLKQDAAKEKMSKHSTMSALNDKKKQDAQEDTENVFARKSVVEPKFEADTRPSVTHRRDPVSLEPHTKLSVVEKDTNGTVRKSGRPRKLNSRIFSDTASNYSTYSMKNVRKSSPEIAKAKAPAFQTHANGVVKKHDKKEPVTPKPETVHSTKWYDASELYKPRPVIQSSSRNKRGLSD